MKTFIKQSLLLGGFYFFASYALSYFTGEKAETLGLFVFAILLLLVIALMFVKSIPILEKFWNKFPIVAYYIAAFGVVKYFSIIFGGIPGVLDGYLLSSTENSDLYHSYFAAYISVFIFLYWTVLWTSLFMATYLSFIKPRMDKQA